MKRILLFLSIILYSLSIMAQSAWMFNHGDSISWQPSQDMTVTYEKDPAGFFWQNIKTSTLDVVRMPIYTSDGITFADTPFLQAEKNRFEVTNNGNRRFEVHLKTNISEWSSINCLPQANWLRLINVNGSQFPVIVYLFECDANYTSSDREAQITFSRNELSDVVSILSVGEQPTLEVSPKEITVTNNLDPRQFTVTLSSNVSEILPKSTYEILGEDTQWLRCDIDGTSESVRTLVFYYDKNYTGTDRNAQIVFKNEQYNLTDTVKIVSVGETPFLQVENKYIEVNNTENHRFEIRLKTNISEYTWSWNSRYLQPSSSSVASVVFEYDPNGIGSYPEIVFFSDQYNIRDTVRVGLETAKAREVLMDFYQATGGDHWNNNTNWGSDKPLNEWYGLEYVYDGSFWGINLYDNNLTGTLPKSLKDLNIYNLYLNHNNLTGTIPEELAEMPNLHVVNIIKNHFNGKFPEKPFSKWMNIARTRSNFCFFENDFTAPIPEWAQKHELFSEFWPEFCCQNGMDLRQISESIYIPGPKYSLTDLDNCVHESSTDYSNNKLTILYRWATWCPYSQSFTPKLAAAYNKYKDSGLKIIGLDDFDGMPHDTQEELEAYCAEHNVTWPNVSLFYSNDERNNSVWPMTLTTETPLLFAIDNKGELIFHSFGGCYNDIIPLLESMFGPIEQEEYYTSTDYSQDGQVITLQKAQQTNAIDIVLMGEAFVDKDMGTDGKYEQKMRAAMEQFFAEEPYKSLRSCFNVYAVKVVSPNAEFASDAKHAINESDEKAFEYAKKALGENAKRLMVGVIYNTNVAINRSYTAWYEGDGSFVAYMMNGVNTVLNHEMGGHGIAFLLDEYIEPGMEDLYPSEEEKADLDVVFANYGEGANVDWRSNPTEVKWAHFINDSRYAMEEIGVYEGAWLRGKGMYRPTENSMMRHNDCGFNAPSREAIYKRVMKLLEGDSWTYDYETFVAFDTPAREIYKQHRSKVQAKGGQEVQKHRIESRPPTIYKGTWRDAGKRNIRAWHLFPF